MTTEVKDIDFPSETELPLREHSAGSRAKKVVPGPRWFAQNPSTPTESVAPINLTTSGSSQPMLMKPRTAYRLISTTAICFKLSLGTATAAVTDIYLPANTEMILRTGDIWNTLNVILATGASAGNAQLTQVL